ncbi:hypothetical protein K505DRAFT_330587 [Melanomma pulvis-pyrius CBS 109.77]|uniref:DUF8021 domain-containing protein n=1 Tax=Melanomma pulvis-pyrius CBS 109.77 TaxID=1314802 RepID=A0A6A6WPS0_9PLEO|nr:hypothetical protein K505DRAFT_330587 [Melanomma pulvis-pyrius CBS 109.77]
MAAQSSGKTDDLSTLFATSFKYRQNNKDGDVKTGLLSKALKLDHNRTIVDTTACATFTELIATGGPYVIGTQLRFTPDGGNITAIDTIAATTGNWMFDAAKTLSYVKTEDWSTVPEASRSDRKTLQAAADAYLDMWSDSSAKAKVPWGNPCTRTEGSMHVTPDCRSGAPSGGGTKNSDRRYVIDETVGSCDVLVAFGGRQPDSHEFRLVGGKLVLVHTVTV